MAKPCPNLTSMILDSPPLRDRLRDDQRHQGARREALTSILTNNPEARDPANRDLITLILQAFSPGPENGGGEIVLMGTGLGSGFEQQVLPPWRYHCIAQWVLEHGRRWHGSPLPEGYRRGKPKNCFYNSLFLGVYQRGLTYVEGYVTSAFCPFPFLHAWNVDNEGKVVDLTRTADRPGDYFGVALSREFVSATLDAREMTGVLDNFQQRFPLLRNDELLERALHPEFKI